MKITEATNTAMQKSTFVKYRLYISGKSLIERRWYPRVYYLDGGRPHHTTPLRIQLRDNGPGSDVFGAHCKSYCGGSSQARGHKTGADRDSPCGRGTLRGGGGGAG